MSPPSRIAALFLLLALSCPVGSLRAGGSDEAGRIIGSALVDGRGYDKLAYLTDRIGHRLSGSENLERAVKWATARFRREGIERVWTEEVMVEHWVRGEEQARIVSPVQQEIALLALGRSVATPDEGLTAEVVAVESFEELEQLGEGARGKIVLFDRPLEPGWGGEYGYGVGSRMRADGASRAARYGAVAMLIRSLGTADFRLPHTGAMRYEEELPKIPAAAISVEDALLIGRLLEAGDTVRVQLQLGCRMLDDAASANVLAELPGRERPEEIVLIGAHLDSWDVGQGAIDDGAGCAIVMEALSLLHRLGLQPRRTIRAVLFTNEENGLGGGQDYARRHGDRKHVVAIESDSGGAAPRGFGVHAGPGGVEIVRELARSLAVIGADAVSAGGGGPDISPLKKLGVPVISLRQDTTHYFDYHHSAADTLDKVDRHDLDRNVAALAWMAYALAELDAGLPRRETAPSAPAE